MAAAGGEVARLERTERSTTTISPGTGSAASRSSKILEKSQHIQVGHLQQRKGSCGERRTGSEGGCDHNCRRQMRN